MPDSCCAVQCTNMRGKCDENITFYRFPIMKNQQTTETRKKQITALKRENWPRTKKGKNQDEEKREKTLPRRMIQHFM